jgi:hypothetical protein
MIVVFDDVARRVADLLQQARRPILLRAVGRPDSPQPSAHHRLQLRCLQRRILPRRHLLARAEAENIVALTDLPIAEQLRKPQQAHHAHALDRLVEQVTEITPIAGREVRAPRSNGGTQQRLVFRLELHRQVEQR